MLKSLFGNRADAAPVPATPENGEEPLPATLGFVGHQPIYTARHELVAYEFAPRDAGHRNMMAAGTLNRHDHLLLQTLENLAIFRLLERRRAFINLSLDALEDPLLPSLAEKRAICIVSPAENDGALTAALPAIKALRAAGLSFALEPALFPETRFSPAVLDVLFAEMNFLVLDFSAQTEDLLEPLLARLPQRYPHARWYARNVNSMEAYEVCRRSQGASERFVLFSGPYLTRAPARHGSGKVDTGQLRVMEILRLLRSGADNEAINAQFKLDSVLLFKLLRFINSPANGLSRQVQTLDETLLLLGREALFRWLSLLLYTAPREDGRNRTLLERSLWRGRFLESLGRAQGNNRLECEHLFVTGMFSTLDALFEQPLSDAIAPLSLPPTISSALIDGQGLFAPYLALAFSLEKGDSARAAAIAARLGCQPEVVNRLQLEAMAWAQKVAAEGG